MREEKREKSEKSEKTSVSGHAHARRLPDDLRHVDSTGKQLELVEGLVILKQQGGTGEALLKGHGKWCAFPAGTPLLEELAVGSLEFIGLFMICYDGAPGRFAATLGLDCNASTTRTFFGISFSAKNTSAIFCCSAAMASVTGATLNW